jgi:UPF0271 protein
MHDIKQICINADLGEGYPWDEQIMPWIQTCNIACGGHAGNKDSIRKTLLLAKKYHVTVGAHPSYPDKNNFGRVPLIISEKDLKKSIIAQINLLLQESEACGVKLHHIKLHGALYHEAAYSRECGKIVLEAFFEAIKQKMLLFAPCASPFIELCKEHDWPVWQEAFIDRNYESNYHLTDRNKENAIIQDPELCLKRLQSMVFQNQITTSTGKVIPIFPNTYCIHGDESGAAKILQYLHVKFSDEHSFTAS